MAKSSDIEYVVDSRGRKKQVIMSYRTYQRLMEDLADLQCMEDRKNETPQDFESIVAELKDAGRL